MLKIVADNAIPFVERFFSCIGEVKLVDGRQINFKEVKDVDVLVCRTVTRVGQQLLQNSAVNIVASASSGTDHIDLDYLHQHSIKCVSAPGSNARSVAEYVLSAVCVLADQKGFDIKKKTVGIIGCGNVGSQLRRFLQALGIECRLYDPFLQQASASNAYSELSEIRHCDIISLHVPLTTDGPYPTQGMLGADFLQALAEDVLLVNTARGGVIDETALLKFLQLNEQAMAVIDVWANEPLIDTALLQRADIATSHIAGYSTDGKLRATQSVFEQVCEIMHIDNHFESLQSVFPADTQHEISLSEYDSDIDAVSLAVLASYDVRGDAAALRRILEDDVADKRSYFSELRNNYPIRREFSSLGIVLAKEAESLRQILLTLGFRISSE